MKQLTCEMCGSTDLMKDGGVFVCQTCGCKYSVEEAKKMMVEVGGAVEVKNAAQLENLLKLANSSFESKNYAQAEEFCNQVIAMDDKNYKAWKLKGEAINYQINSKNQRILEVYNCIMTSYRILSDEEKAIKKYEIISSLKTCFEGEVDFWLKQFEAGRPTNAALTRAKNAYIDAYNKMKAAFEELGLEESKQGYLTNFDNFFVGKCNAICNDAWKSTVGYNYYRDYMGKGKDPFGRTNQSWIIKDTDLYRPSKHIWDTFLEEADNLIKLLQFAEEQFNDDTNPKVMEAIYSNIIFFEECIIPSGSWKITQGYTSTWDQYKSVGWHEEYSLTTGAKDARRAIISRYEKKIEDLRVRAEKRAQKVKEARIKAYWEKHTEEKSALDSEAAQLRTVKEQCTKEITDLQEEKKSVPALSKLIQVQKNIEKAEDEKSALGMFKGKEKKALQSSIDLLVKEKDQLKQQVATQQQEIETKIESVRVKLNPALKRLKEIEAELTKDRKEN